VGVFVDEPVERVRAVLDLTGLDLAQLHGAEPPSVLRALAPRAFKAIRPQTPPRRNCSSTLTTRTRPAGRGCWRTWRPPGGSPGGSGCCWPAA
jgi:phosphoribosylanthranilate isomerase